MMDAIVPMGAVLVGLDASAGSAKALEWAAAEARRRKWPLHLMHVLDVSHRTWPTYSMTRQVHEPVINNALAHLVRSGEKLKVTWSEPTGDPATTLASAARGCRLVVVGSRGRSAAADAFLGSTTNRLIAQTRCPVAVLRADTNLTTGTSVVAGLEYGRPFVRVLETAFEQAGTRHLDLTIVLHRVPNDEAQHRENDRLARSMADVARSHPQLRVTTHTVRDGAIEELRRYATDPALVVVGSLGHGEFGGAVLGSVHQGVLRSATCPVLVVRDGRKAFVASPPQAAAGA
ncbi:universal stress protein [Flexivirga oryzae]|uniref:Nucleotide-binding universal stress UspA family protein n=1 Tax=Flexivirga oryzae TaxID=1794944 RepID=A0A839N428_9MICO|nr:universal stress protein [Flexivirga oryzae]MBB2892488.1 nucleotide-binding universal stress UspA family protein [Flexivirga oryzae]